MKLLIISHSQSLNRNPDLPTLESGQHEGLGRPDQEAELRDGVLGKCLQVLISNKQSKKTWSGWPPS